MEALCLAESITKQHVGRGHEQAEHVPVQPISDHDTAETQQPKSTVGTRRRELTMA